MPSASSTTPTATGWPGSRPAGSATRRSGGRDQRDVRGGVPQPRLLPGRHRFRGVAVHHRPPAGRRPLPAPVPPPGGRPRRGGSRRGGAACGAWGRPGRGRARGGPAGRRAAGRGRRGVPGAAARPAGGPGPAGARRPVGGPGRRGARQVGGGGAGRPAPGPPVPARGDGGDGRMTPPNGNGPMGPGGGPMPPGGGPLGPTDDRAALAALDLALDELAAGDVAASPIEGEAAVLAAVAAELRAAVPPAPPGAVERGRAAFLARAAELQGEPATAELDGAPATGGPEEDPATARLPRKAPASPAVGRRRRLPVRVLALAAALVVLAAVPAVARQARPGSALWPVRQAGQELRVSLADDPVRRAHLRLNTAEEYLAAGARAGEERRENMADKAEELIDEVLDQLEDVSGGRAAVERARAERLLPAVRALEQQDDQESGSGSSGSGSGSSGSGSGEDRSGRDGSGSGSSDDDRSGRGGGDDGGDDDGGSGSGMSGSSGSTAPASGSGSGSSGSPGSNRSG